MSTVFEILIVLAAAFFVLGLSARFWRRRYALELGADATHYARTADGWRLAVHRYPGGEGDPVLLCHGMGANAFNWDLGDRLSLARYLKRRGYDVWNLELRGNGHSRARNRSRRAPRHWSFDDHVRQDLPAAIDCVLAETNRPRLHWVGHSLGGLVIYGHLATTGDTRIASICTLGSHSHFESVGRLRQLAPLMSLAGWVPALPIRLLASAVIPFYRALPFRELTHHVANVDSKTIRLALANLVEPVSKRTLRQVALWMRTGRLVSSDGQVDYGAGLANVDTPACLIAGSVDRLAPPADVRRAFELLASTVKQYELIGKESGATNDYGHGDLAVGRNAPEDVYARIAGWLDDRRAGRTRRPTEHRVTAAPASTGKPTRVSPTEAPSEPTTNPYDPYARLRRERRHRSSARAVQTQTGPTTDSDRADER